MIKDSDMIEDDGFITVHPIPGVVYGDIPKHGSPQDRGSADAYYGRRPEPHWWPEGTGHGTRIEKADMTVEQIRQYWYGYDNENDRKDWG